MKDKKVKKNLLNNIVFILAVISNAVFLALLYNITIFSRLSQSLFVALNLVVLFMLLCINVLVIFQFKSTKRNYFLGIVSFILLTILAGAGFMYVSSTVTDTVNTIIVDGSVTESMELAVVINVNEHEEEVELKDFSGKTVGIIQESLNAEIVEASKSEFNDLNMNVEFVEYVGYQDIIIALLKGEIDCGVLPSNYDYMFASESDEDYLAPLKVIYSYNKEITYDSEGGKQIDIANEPFNVLLIGMDESHSDVLMLATFNPIAFEVSYTSIPRDSFVPICGNSKQKIAHSRNYGRACTIQTVEDLMDIKIDYFFEANFQGVVDMVDALGGIAIDSPIEFVGQTASYKRGTKTVKIFKGLHLLNGEQALAFARERKAFNTGDFQRQLNQQQVITSFLSELVRVRDVNVALNVLEAAGENVRTNIPIDMMIDLFSLVINKVDRSYEKGFSALSIKSSRLTGYSSNQYDEGLELILWIYRLYNGSIEENRNLILSNLELKDQELADLGKFQWSANWQYASPVLFHEYFDEKQVHDPLPDLVGTWTGKYLSELKSWATARGINVIVNEIREGMEGYDANLGNGYILTQDTKAGRLSSKISSITVNAIRIIPKVPNFTEWKLSDVKSGKWEEEYGFKIGYHYIKSHDASGVPNSSYVDGKVGAIASQSIPAWTFSDGSFSQVDLYIYDYPYVVDSIPTAADGLDAIKEWADSKLVDNSDTRIVYGDAVITYDQTLDGKVYSVQAVKDGEPFVKTNGSLSVVLYKYQEEPSVEVPNFVGGSIDSLLAWFKQYNMAPTGTEGSECGENNPVVVLSISGLDGITSIKPSELKTKTVNYTYCKVYVAPNPVVTPDSSAGSEETNPETENSENTETE